MARLIMVTREVCDQCAREKIDELRDGGLSVSNLFVLSVLQVLCVFLSTFFPPSPRTPRHERVAQLVELRRVAQIRLRLRLPTWICLWNWSPHTLLHVLSLDHFRIWIWTKELDFNDPV